MKRIVVHRPGDYRRLSIEHHPDPRPAPGEVLIDVAACGVNYADCVTRMGLYASAKALVGYPITPGFEVAGTVAEIGEDVTDLTPGERVLGVTLFGGYVTRIALPRAQVFPVPANMDLVEAAGFPTVFLTAWFALHELAHPRTGETLLVHSAAGGVGGALVQLGQRAGCRVVGVVGAPHKVTAVEALGADAVIDKSTQDLWREAHALAPDGYDVVLDANGASTLRQSYRHLAPLGRLVVYGFHAMLPKRGGRLNWLRLARDYLRMPRFNPLTLTLTNRSVLAFNLSFLTDRIDLLAPALHRLLRWRAEDHLQRMTITTYPFDNVADAQRDLESGRTVGKLVLITDEIDS